MDGSFKPSERIFQKEIKDMNGFYLYQVNGNKVGIVQALENK